MIIVDDFLIKCGCFGGLNFFIGNLLEMIINLIDKKFDDCFYE